MPSQAPRPKATGRARMARPPVSCQSSRLTHVAWLKTKCMYPMPDPPPVILPCTPRRRSLDKRFINKHRGAHPRTGRHTVNSPATMTSRATKRCSPASMARSSWIFAWGRALRGGPPGTKYAVESLLQGDTDPRGTRRRPHRPTTSVGPSLGPLPSA